MIFHVTVFDLKFSFSKVMPQTSLEVHSYTEEGLFQKGPLGAASNCNSCNDTYVNYGRTQASSLTNRLQNDWDINSVEKHVLSMHEALGLIPSIKNRMHPMNAFLCTHAPVGERTEKIMLLHLSVHPSIYTFIQQAFIECLLHASHCASCLRYIGK
jgi:hypothetical protein